MARPIDPNAQYRVSVHNIGGYRYASTQPSYRDPETAPEYVVHKTTKEMKAAFAKTNSWPGKRINSENPLKLSFRNDSNAKMTTSLPNEKKKQ